MDEQNMEFEETESYHPRPLWQRLCAILAVLLLIIGFLLYCYHIANGGI